MYVYFFQNAGGVYNVYLTINQMCWLYQNLAIY